MAKGSTTVPAIPAKSGGARNESASPDMTGAYLSAAIELSDSSSRDRRRDSGDGDASVGTERGDEDSRNLAGKLDDIVGPDPDYNDYDDVTEGSKPSVVSAKRSALLNTPRPPINGDSPAAKPVVIRVQALMQNDGRMQLFKPIPTRQADWSALAHELQFPVNLITTSQVAEVSASLLLALRYENKTYPSTMLLQDWSPLEAGSALQKRKKKKLSKAFGATSINAGKQPVSRQGQVEEDPSKIPLPQTLRSGDRTRRDKTGADRGAFGTTEASTYFQDSHIVMPSSASRTARMNAANEISQGSHGEDEDPQAELASQMKEMAALNDADPTSRTKTASHRPLDRIKPFTGFRNKSENSMQWLRTFVYEMTGTHEQTKRKWRLLSNVFISLMLLAVHPVSSITFKKGGLDAKEHVQQFLITCGDNNIAKNIYHTQVSYSPDLEEIIEDVLKGMRRMVKRVNPREATIHVVKSRMGATVDVIYVNRTVAVTTTASRRE
ncbi:hypothetical protein PC110_g8531 [Phytophthora cactorum]|uniref:Uncharacterized protein n=1 Tax=Phytophthora cactorum TaxID=29920 RepID=A0A329SEV8_9STRA|nr:hypothetical protein PC112_g19436 [Phytophthora cactorum]KAG2882244.1 hypothetical protein PC114_g21131 [Phytophthora cactorum]KAG2898543.1 hypothetical protein PC117_g22491 [Phytophthora cactorum]KAG2976418.1 hypothetical protein PC119_g22198 [Phytophthora cactorum]KAG3136428.1 hypothetical protein C6341_g21391 [Phytophthora cactorum]